MRPTVAILGAGAMGKNLALGLLGAGWEAGEIVLADRFEAVAAEAHRLTGIEAVLDLAQAVAGREVVVLAVKPNDVASVLNEAAPVLAPTQVVVSLAAGVPLSVLEGPLDGIPVVRTMPNTPAAVGRAMTAFSGGAHAGRDALKKAEVVLAAVGRTLQVEEAELDVVTAVSGSGPAYVFLLAEALEAAAEQEGLSTEEARLLVEQTLLGASHLLQASARAASELRRDVTSPGGTTAAALEVFEAGGFRDLIRRAVHAAAERSRELGASAAAPNDRGG